MLKSRTDDIDPAVPRSKVPLKFQPIARYTTGFSSVDDIALITNLALNESEVSFECESLRMRTSERG